MTRPLIPLSFKLKDKSLCNSGQGFNFKCISHHGCGNFSDLRCSDYWKMHCENIPLWHDLINSSPMYNNPHTFAQKGGGGTMIQVMKS